jgi:hypothetical protein
VIAKEGIAMANGGARRLSVVCRDPINFSVPQYKTCCTAALYYMYYTAGQGGVGAFEIAMRGKNPERLIWNLARAHGTRRTRRFMMASTPLQVAAGSILVFMDDRMVRHVCVASNGNELYCHNQGGWFTGCGHGAAGAHCHHSSGTMKWSDNTHAGNGNHECRVYTIKENQALNWIRRNL